MERLIAYPLHPCRHYDGADCNFVAEYSHNCFILDRQFTRHRLPVNRNDIIIQKEKESDKTTQNHEENASNRRTDKSIRLHRVKKHEQTTHTQTILTQRTTTKQQRQQQPSNHSQNRKHHTEQQTTIKQIHKIDVRTNFFGHIMLTFKEMNKIHTQIILAKRTTAKQQRQ